VGRIAPEEPVEDARQLLREEAGRLPPAAEVADEEPESP